MMTLNTLFNMSVTGSAIFLLILLLRPVSKKHFSSSWHYKMLILVLFFFIIPVIHFLQVPTIQIPNIIDLKVQKERIPDNINTNIDLIGVREAKNDVKDYTIMEIENQEAIIKDNEKIRDVKPITQDSRDIQNIKFNIDFFQDMIKYIWLIGVIILLLLKIVPYIKFKSSILKHSVTIEENDIIEQFNICKDELKINREIPLRTCKFIGSPMLIGMFNPIVLIPDLNKDTKRLKMIFLHELNHYRRKDILIKVFSLIINSIHWFNPITYVLLRDMDKYCEYSIDEKVVEDMDIKDRKYYGETILFSINSSILNSHSFTTAMGTNGRQLKTRLEKMIYSFKISRKKQIISFFIGILILATGFMVAYSILPSQAAAENDSFLVYVKEGGLYYSYLDGGDEIRIQKGKEFSYPLISRTGDYIAYTKDKSLYIYDVKNRTYEKITERQYVFNNFYDWIDDEIAYSTEEPGFIIYNPSTKEKKYHMDEYHYCNFKSSSENFLYGKQTREWSTEEGHFVAIHGIVEINLNDYDEKDNKFKMETIIEAKAPTDAMLEYDPTISKISEDGRYVFIMEKFQSGSTSADYAGIGLYDTVEKIHIDFTDIYGKYDKWESTYEEEEEDLVVLPNINNMAINSNRNGLIGIIKGGFRERFMNKKMVLLDINEDKSYDNVNITDTNLVAMTPSFTLDGDKLLYSATEAIDPNKITDYNQAYRDWENQPHNIYEYDLKHSLNRKLTSGDNFDFMPISIPGNGILVCRLQDNGYGKLIKIMDDREDTIANDVVIDYFTEGNMDIFISGEARNKSKIKPIDDNNNNANKSALNRLANKEFYIKEEGNKSLHEQTIIEFGKSFVNLFNGAVKEQQRVSFEKYISNKNLREFTDKILELTQIQVRDGRSFVNYGLENEFDQAKLRLHPVDEAWYLELPFQFEGSGMIAKLLISPENNALKLIDLYFGNKDGIDTFATGHPAERNVKDPYLWENEEWVKDVFDKLKKLEETDT